MNIDTLFMGAIILLMISALLTLLRMIFGPTLPDRVVALDAMTTTTSGVMVLYGVLTEQSVIIDVALVYAILSFVATLYIAKYLEKKKVGVE